MSEKQNIKSDYEYSRETYYDLLEKGRGDLQRLLQDEKDIIDVTPKTK